MTDWQREQLELKVLCDRVRVSGPALEGEIEATLNLLDIDLESALVRARRALEVIVIDLCESRLQRERGTEPLASLLARFKNDVPESVLAAMHYLNQLGNLGAHPKAVRNKDVRQVLVALISVVDWYVTDYKQGFGDPITACPGDHAAQDHPVQHESDTNVPPADDRESSASYSAASSSPLRAKSRSRAAVSAAEAKRLVILYKRRAQPDGHLLQVLETGLTTAGHCVFVDRHMSMGVAAGIVIALLLGTIYFVWDSQSRLYEEYFTAYAKRWGSPEGVGRLSESERRHRSVSFKLIRHGRRNPLEAMEAVNAADNCTPRNDVGTYFKAGNRWEATTDKECRWEFVRDKKDQVVYEKAFNAKGRLVWGLVYSPRVEGQPHRAHFVGPDGFPAPQLRSAAEIVELHGGQAEALGLRVGDILTQYAGKPLHGNFLAFIAERDTEPADGPAQELLVRRGSQELQFMVHPGKMGLGVQDRGIDVARNAEASESEDALASDGG
jgi:hypothetical protein